MEARDDVGAELISAARAAGTSRSGFNASASSDDDDLSLDPEDEAALQQFFSNPQAALEEIVLGEVQGEQKVDLLYALYTGQNCEQITTVLLPLVSVADAQLYQDTGCPTAEAFGKNGEAPFGSSAYLSDDEYSNVALHLMAGAGAALVGSAIAYRAVPWFRPITKVAFAAAIGVASAAFAGAAKELYDFYNPPHEVSWRKDFMNTLGAGAAAGVFVFRTGCAMTTIGIGRTPAAIFWTVTGLVIARPALKNLIGL